jgi:hypothetical protein
MRRASRLRGQVGRLPTPLLILLVIALVHGTAWTIATAPVEGPDEDAHIAYAQYFAETGKGPYRSIGNGTYSTQFNSALIGLNLWAIRGHSEGMPFWALADQVNRESRDQPRNNGNGPNAAGNYPPLYYAYAAVAYRLSPDRTILGRIWAMRFAGVILFIGMVWLAWLVAAEVFAATWKRTLVAAIVALQPKLGFMAGAVNPDIMLSFLGTAALLVGLRIAITGVTWRRALTLGGIAAAGVLCHPRGLFLPPFAVVAMAVGLWRFRRPWRFAAGTIAACLAPAVIGLIAAVLWTRHYSAGTAFGSNSPVAAFDLRQFFSYLWQFYLPGLTSMEPKVGPDYGYRQVFIETYFGTFGSLEINFPLWINSALQFAAGILGLWVFGLTIRRAESVARRWYIPVIMLALSLGLLLLLHIVSYGNLRGVPLGTGDPVITGRYLLPLTAVLGCAIAWVFGALPRRLQPLAAGAAVAAMAMLSIAAVGMSLERFGG